MSTLEKTINLLNDLPENEVEIIYSYVRFISSQHEERKKATEPIEDIFNNIVGVLPDTGKTAKQYHEERIIVNTIIKNAFLSTYKKEKGGRQL